MYNTINWTQSEYEIVNKENYLIDLVLKWTKKIINPIVIILTWAFLMFMLMFILFAITGKDFFMIMNLYILYCMLGLVSLLVIAAISFIVLSGYLIRELIKASRIFEVSKNIIDPVDGILKNTQYIHKLISTIRNINRFMLFFGEKQIIIQINEFLRSDIQSLLKFLDNLRSDLQIRLTEQQNILESAKSDVSKNIHWTSELDHVSELQKIRLDRQIEQFEELQRVLVKI